MSYIEKEVWTIQPLNTFKVIRNCSKCDCKSKYSSTGNFRVNANGNYLDVWLIYQCEKCKNTFNLPIYERINPNKIPKKLYQGFLSNNKELAFEYALKKEIFSNNQVEIDSNSLEYEIEIFRGKRNIYESKVLVMIKNPYSLYLRLDKILARQLTLSRTQVKNYMDKGMIYNPQMLDIKKIVITESLEVIINLGNDVRLEERKSINEQ
jgi:hypothetical protein